MKKFLFFLVILIITNHLFYKYLLTYTEKTSYIWSEINNREIPVGEYDLLILGDSQVMSGIHPLKLSNETNLKILFYPRPSEQVEGIYFHLKNFYKKGFKFKKILVNFSEISSSKNPILESHKSLSLNFQNFSFSFFTDKILFSLYLKNLSNSVYYFITEIFPLLKLNSNFTREINLVPKSEGIILTQNIEPILYWNIFGNLKYNLDQNSNIKKFLVEENFYLDWKDLHRTCNPNEQKMELPTGSELAFTNLRKESIPVWLKLSEIAKENSSEIFYIKIPFSNIFQTKLKENPHIIQADFYLIESIKKNLGEDRIIFVDSKFKDSDFGDYTHLNVCGMIQLTKELSLKLNQFK